MIKDIQWENELFSPLTFNLDVGDGTVKITKEHVVKVDYDGNETYMTEDDICAFIGFVYTVFDLTPEEMYKQYEILHKKFVE